MVPGTEVPGIPVQRVPGTEVVAEVVENNLFLLQLQY